MAGPLAGGHHCHQTLIAEVKTQAIRLSAAQHPNVVDAIGSEDDVLHLALLDDDIRHSGVVDGGDMLGTEEGAQYHEEREKRGRRAPGQA